jgi:hypothetical protein
MRGAGEQEGGFDLKTLSMAVLVQISARTPPVIVDQDTLRL